MVINVANLILCLPVACTLAVILAATGGQILRPKQDLIRTFVLVLIWLLITLAMFGLFVRQTRLGIILFFGFVFIITSIVTSERSLARSTILLALLAHHDRPSRLQIISKYLKLEGTGYWKRLGLAFENAYAATGNWIAATKSARIARDEYDQIALGVLQQTGDRQASLTQIIRSIDQRQLGSQWRGRLVAAAFSLIPLMIISVMLSPGLGPVGNTFVRMLDEFGYPRSPQLNWWVAVSAWQLHIVVPLLVWGAILAAYIIKTFPALRLYGPVRWFFSNQHRALCLEGLADIIEKQPRMAQACRDVASAMPVTYWSEQLSGTARSVDAGEDFLAALKKNRLLKHPESTALALCQNPASLAWALREICQAIWLRTQTRTNLLVQFLVLVLVFVSACLTAVIVLSVMSTLADLISLTEEMSRHPNQRP